MRSSNQSWAYQTSVPAAATPSASAVAREAKSRRASRYVPITYTSCSAITDSLKSSSVSAARTSAPASPTTYDIGDSEITCCRPAGIPYPEYGNHWARSSWKKNSL